MNNYLHFVSGFFAHSKAADDVFKKLIAQGLPKERVQMYSKLTTAPVHESTEGSDQVFKEILVDGTIGTVVGSGVGALTYFALIASNVSLFVASPIIAPLVLLGWGASIGGVVGASIGAAENAKSLSALIEEAIAKGHIVVMAETHTASETTIAQQIIKDSIGDFKDVDAA